MTLALDLSKAVRSRAGYRELVLAVYQAPASEQETNSIEWKGTVDLAEKRWQAEMGRQVLGMSNRDAEAAGKVLGGCGYILLGVSPGELPGTRVYDADKIENWIAAYVGQPPNAPEWMPTYVHVHDKDVLVLTIEPPRDGHPAWPCRKEYLADPRSAGTNPKPATREGAVYVRHKASTREATAADIEMLSRRTAGARKRIGRVSLLLVTESRAVALDIGPEAIAVWADREREALKPPPPRKPEGSEATSIKLSDLPESSPLRSLAGMSSVLEAAMQANVMAAKVLGLESDSRTPEQYDKEVDEYITKATEALPGVLLKGCQVRGLGRVAFVLRNDTDDPIHGLLVEVRIPAKGVMALHEDEIPNAKMPTRPVMLGMARRSRLDYLGGLGYPSLLAPSFRMPAISPIRRVHIDNSHSVVLTFDPLDLYPEDTAELDEVWLFANPAVAGTTLAAEWSARSRDASGVLRETLEIEVDPIVRIVDELLAEVEESTDEE